MAQEKSIPSERTRSWVDPYEYGRIRLYNHTSYQLRQILNRERLRLYIERKRARNLGSETLTTWNREIAQVTQMLDEVNRLRREKGWVTTDGEHKRGDPQTTGAELSEGSSEPMD